MTVYTALLLFMLSFLLTLLVTDFVRMMKHRKEGKKRLEELRAKKHD